jgi:hypothetical protein
MVALHTLRSPTHFYKLMLHVRRGRLNFVAVDIEGRYRPCLAFRIRSSNPRASKRVRSHHSTPQGPTFIADAVLGRDGFLVGAEAHYNVTEGRVTKYATAVGYSAPEYAVSLHGSGNLSQFTASYYHRVSPDVEAGAKATYDTKAAGAVGLEVGAKAYVYGAFRAWGRC